MVIKKQILFYIEISKKLVSNLILNFLLFNFFVKIVKKNRDMNNFYVKIILISLRILRKYIFIKYFYYKNKIMIFLINISFILLYFNKFYISKFLIF